jgi:Tol biopolymer transport system component
MSSPFERPECMKMSVGRADHGQPPMVSDGQEISFDSNTGGNFQIYTVSADGGPPRQLTKDPFTNFTTNWSHDGRWIYFASKRSGDFQIWSYN